MVSAESSETVHFVNRNPLEETKVTPQVKEIQLLNIQITCGTSFIGIVLNYYLPGEPKPIFLNKK